MEPIEPTNHTPTPAPPPPPAVPSPGFGAPTAPAPPAPPQFGSMPPSTPYGYAVPGTPVKNKGLAIAAMVLGIVGLASCFIFVPSILAVIFGAVSLKSIKANPQALKGKGMAIAGLVTGIVGIIAGGIFWIANADEIKEGVEAATAGFDVNVGDCVKIPDGTVIVGLPRQDCDKAHGGEVFLVDELADGDYPGEIETQNSVVQSCLDDFDAYVGKPYAESSLDSYFVYPQEDRWAEGDRQFVCILVDKTGADLPGGSAKGSGR